MRLHRHFKRRHGFRPKFPAGVAWRRHFGNNEQRHGWAGLAELGTGFENRIDSMWSRDVLFFLLSAGERWEALWVGGHWRKRKRKGKCGDKWRFGASTAG
ncbi:hypothetical protein VFPPC_04051 [Pochonia chlamydosporia 170]|uniref:Uncharacterized protein n=1 Tax=Pochonia chlamydosporia 170 TaxID=1380566 RepID=A0A179FPZ2_METCM|nr:hypothetical protein VFPPC_04051 [Pochonia chlamydosporia 170]OAQ67696.1 hypothetical protein VFPPC_04051 [Pochonia chlamydosporia 170]